MKLSEIMPKHPNIVIAIDGEITPDRDGNYLVNAGYIRVSTDKQADEGFGLEIQREQIEKYCTQNNLRNLVLFVDDGHTGTNLKRPALIKFFSMLGEYRIGNSKIGFSRFIIPRIDRIARSLRGALEFIYEHLMPTNDAKNKNNYTDEDIDFISISENLVFEKNNPQNIFIFQIYASVAELDRNLIVDKLKRGRTARAAKGLWNGSGSKNRPYGYMYNKDLNQGELIINEAEADIVRKVYTDYIENHLSPAAIAAKYNLQWEANVINILERKLYAGKIIFNGIEYDGLHPPIISMETWIKAQEEKEKRSKHHGNPQYLLTGLLYCGCCGSKLRYQKWGKTRECKLVCYSQQPSKAHLVKDPNCDLPQFWAKDVENAITKQLFSYKIKLDTTKKKIDDANVLDKLKKQLSTLRKIYSSYQRQVILDELDPDLAESAKVDNRYYRDKTNREMVEIESQIKEEESKQLISKQVKQAENILANLESTWEYMSQKQKREVCRELIDRVTIYKDNRIELKLRLAQFII